jgi:hypothetical protein
MFLAALNHLILGLTNQWCDLSWRALQSYCTQKRSNHQSKLLHQTSGELYRQCMHGLPS